MIISSLRGGFSINLESIAKAVNAALPVVTVLFFLVGYQLNFFFHFLTVAFFLLTSVNFFYRHVQKKHALLANYGVIAQLRYMIESVGPEFRQYLFMSDTEEKPFNRVERSEIYRKSKGIDSSSAFGSLLLFDQSEIKLRHSMYPMAYEDLRPYSITFGEERGIASAYSIHNPVMISGMSYGALGHRAVRALARGARRAEIPMNTGEGGYPKYHLMEGCDLIFQLGTAKFGVRHEDGTLDEAKLAQLSAKSPIRMIEIKLSQGAKPGKGGLLPKEKITSEISELRGVPMGVDVVSPPHHAECHDAASTVRFLARIQEVSQLPVGIKLCLGREDQFLELVQEMKRQDVFPDYLALDGAEGGTGAAPKAFMDDLGVPILAALPRVRKILSAEGVRDRTKVVCSGKMVSTGRQFVALSLGAQAIYTARGFMMALGCIQALQCNKNTCPVGITTHVRHLQAGLDIEEKAKRVERYIYQMVREQREVLAALGKSSILELDEANIYREGYY